MAYIDSKLAEMRKDEADAQFVPSAAAQGLHEATETGHDRKPASSGRLQEIDLGPDAMLRNIRRTELAAQRMHNGKSVDEQDPPKPPRMRLGRDGKPMKPRRRFRRKSEDIERDNLVDSILKETRREYLEVVSTESSLR